MNENILVIKKNLIPTQRFQGLQPLAPTDLDLIQQNKEFHPRPVMEEDVTYKQIIPYLIFTHAKPLLFNATQRNQIGTTA